jgi:hypothetical protein
MNQQTRRYQTFKPQISRDNIRRTNSDSIEKLTKILFKIINPITFYLFISFIFLAIDVGFIISIYNHLSKGKSIFEGDVLFNLIFVIFSLLLLTYIGCFLYLSHKAFKEKD